MSLKFPMIFKDRWKCKCTSQVSLNGKWANNYIKDKWYDGEYQIWSWEDGYRLNGGWAKYWAYNERGVKEELSMAKFKAIFYHEINEVRDAKIDLLLN